MPEQPTTSPGQIAVRAQPSGLAVMGLLLATLAWAGSFTWAKAAGDSINQSLGLPSGALFGPILLLAWRFTAAGLLWLLLVPGARRGWTRRSFRRSAFLGLLLWLGQTVQMLGLDRTSEAVNAFLTSLTVIFVPLLMVVVVKRPPPPALWLPIGMAAVGIWLMTGASPTGVGVGEALGLGCAILFSAHMIVLGEVGREESPWRLAAGQFLIVGIASAVTSLLVSHDSALLTFQAQWQLVTSDAIWPPLLLLIVVSTMIAFGLMFYFQPKLDPARAALTYLAEPIFAALYAYVAVGRALSPIAITGAALILAANVLVEYLERRPGLLSRQTQRHALRLRPPDELRSPPPP